MRCNYVSGIPKKKKSENIREQGQQDDNGGHTEETNRKKTARQEGQDDENRRTTKGEKRKANNEEPYFSEEPWNKRPKKEKQRKTYFDSQNFIPDQTNTRHRNAETPPLPHCPWGGRFKKTHMSNTCTIDNFLYLLYVLIYNNDHIRAWFEAESAGNPVAALILRIANLFHAGRWSEGKFEWITANIQSHPGRDIDLFGTETEYFVVHYGELQTNTSELTCSNERCHGQTDQNNENLRMSGEIVLR